MKILLEFDSSFDSFKFANKEILLHFEKLLPRKALKYYSILDQFKIFYKYFRIKFSSANEFSDSANDGEINRYLIRNLLYRIIATGYYRVQSSRIIGFSQVSRTEFNPP